MTTNITASQLDANTLDSWKGQPALDSEGKKLGKIKDIYLDDTTQAPKWVAVTITGLLTEKVRLAPIAEAVRQDDGVHLTHPKDKIEQGPEIEATGQLSPTDERKLLYHFEIEFNEQDLKQQGEQPAEQPAPRPEPDGKPRPEPPKPPQPPAGPTRLASAAPPAAVATTPSADQPVTHTQVERITLKPNQTVEVTTQDH